MRPLTTSLLALALALLTACSGPPLLDGADHIESARLYRGLGDLESAAELAEIAIDDHDDLGLDSRAVAEATWIAAECRFEQGEDVAAARHYRWLLESAPYSPHLTAIESRLFTLGERLLYDEKHGGWFDDRGRGVEVMTLVQVHFSRSDRADDALRHVADYFASEDVEEWDEASRTYYQLFDEYPASEWAERSLWMAAHCQLERVYKAAYNRRALLKALRFLKLSREVHPRGAAMAQVRDDLASCRELLAATHLAIAEFYAGRGRGLGEELHLANAAAGYGETESGQLARQRLLARGLDPAALAADPAYHSLDMEIVLRGPWDDDQDWESGR